MEWRGDMGEDQAELDALGQSELLERVCDDQVRRWHAGQRVPAEAYLARHPRLEGESESAFELVYGEFLLREQRGDPASPEEFYWRFPHFAARLARQLELHGVLNAESPALRTDAESAAERDEAQQSSPASIRSVAPGYEILGELGRGGMGAVYKAWQVSLKRIVALKVIRADAYADSGAAARFHAEAEAAARIQHPNIVQVFEVGENDGLGYLVLEYVAGEGLDRKLSGALQDPREAARLIEVLARAIHFAHQRGIVHRDLKPANVLMTEDGVPKITDFGLAKLLERDHGLTQVGDLLGTPSYMAPEQVRGRSDQVTPATDVYALGAILYEMLTGRPPFKGTTPLSILEQVSTQEPLTPSKIQRHTAARPGNHLPQVPAQGSAPAVSRPRGSWPMICAGFSTASPFWPGRRRCGSVPGNGPDAVPPPPRCSAAPSRRRFWLPASASITTRGSRGIANGAGRRAGGRLERPRGGRTAQPGSQSLQTARVRRSGKAGTDSRHPLAPAGVAQYGHHGLEEIARSTSETAPDLSQAVAHQKLGDIFRIIGRSADARLHYDRSRGLSEDLLATCSRRPCRGQKTSTSRTWAWDCWTSRFDNGMTQRSNFATPSISRKRFAADRAYEGGREGLVEAYLQLGRSYSFAGDFPAAELWFRKMQALASRWVSERPTDTLARDLLAASYRKLGDLKKFAKDYAGARADYLTAITLGRQILADDPGSLTFKAHLAIGLDDLAGVARSQGETAEARDLYREAGQLGADLVKADPEALEARFRFLHTQYKLAQLEKSESQFARAAQLFRSVLGDINRLDRDGLLEGRHDAFTNPSALKVEIAQCDSLVQSRSALASQHSRGTAKRTSAAVPPRVKTPE